MTELLKSGDRLVFAEPGFGDGEKSDALHLRALSPFLIGLVVPFLVIYLMDPAMVRPVRLVIWLGLMCLFLLSCGLFVFSAMSQQRLTNVVCDPATASIELTWRGPLSSEFQSIPFKDIAFVRLRSDETEDGYPTSVPELVLRSRQVIALPPATTESQVRVLRAVIGLG